MPPLIRTLRDYSSNMPNNEIVSIVIPCRNEESFIGRCLDSILANDYPSELLEVLVVDGFSDDRTPAVVRSYVEAHPEIRLLENPFRTTPAAMNIGIASSKGSVIVIASAHSEYPRDFVAKSVEWLERTGVEVVGGPLCTKPGAETTTARLIALATSHRFGVGNSKFRTAAPDGFVDTVPFGAYRREVFDRVGLFDERLLRNQDNELCSRILARGGKIFLTADLQAAYYSRRTLRELASQAFRNGMWNVLTVRLTPAAFRWRHFIPFVFVTALASLAVGSIAFESARPILGALICLYGLAALLASVNIQWKTSAKCALLLPPVFFILHSAYGIGTWRGLFRLALTPWGAVAVPGRSQPS